MTTSVVFDNIDYSEIDYDVSSPEDGPMLTDPSASIIALQGLRVLKTRETGDQVVVPDTTGRSQVSMLNFNGINYEERRMRRKSEILKYNKNSTINKRTQYSALASSRRGQLTTSAAAAANCNSDIIRVKSATNSGIICGNSSLSYNPNISFIDKL